MLSPTDRRVGISIRLATSASSSSFSRSAFVPSSHGRYSVEYFDRDASHSAGGRVPAYISVYMVGGDEDGRGCRMDPCRLPSSPGSAITLSAGVITLRVFSC